MVGIGFWAWRSSRSFDDDIPGGRSPGGFVTSLPVGASERLAAEVRKRLNRHGALAGMVVGAATAIVWKQYAASSLYVMVPEVLAATAVVVLPSLLNGAPTAPMPTTHRQLGQILREQGH